MAVAFTFVFAMSYATFAIIKATIGIRVSEDDEEAGLDIVEHGMYGYPEQFIPQSEISSGIPSRLEVPAPSHRGATATASEGAPA